MDWYTASTGSAKPAKDAGAIIMPASLAPDASQPRVRWFWEEVAAQQGRTVLWLPVALVCGLMVYFTLPVEPPVLVGVIFAVIALGLFAGVRVGKLHPFALIVGFVLAGITLGQLNTGLKATKVLPASTGKVTVLGYMDELGPAFGNRRIVAVRIDDLPDVKPQYWPEKARLSVFAKDLGQVRSGDYVTFQAWLYPPLTPVAPGSWDYGQVNWFDGIGAGGRIDGPIMPSTAKPRLDRLSDEVVGLRAGISARIRASLPEREAGFAVALITGERAGLDKETRDALQVSGLAHILAISGLHMSLVAGGVFWVVRALLALWPAIALHWPIKKVAAVSALFAAGFYLLISGQAIATQRAFIMLSVMFLAVLLGRSALSMRNLAIAAIIVLVIAPHAVLTPSFQMSFLAVMGLIAGYESLGAWQTVPVQKFGGRSHILRICIKVLLGIAAISATTIIASVLTTLPAAYHFNRFAAWSLPANVLAMPFVTIMVMPFAVAGVALMPFGLEYWPFQVMHLGLASVEAIAVMVAGWPGSSVVIAQMHPGLAFFSMLSLCFMCLWRGTLKWAGGPAALVLGLMAIWLGPRPDIVVERTALTMAARLDQGLLVPVYARKGSFAVNKWLLSDGDGATMKQAGSRTGWSCADDRCVAKVKGKTVIWLGRKAKPTPACKQADIVISANPLRRSCGYKKSGQVHIDRFDVWRSGAHSISIASDGTINSQHARAAAGDRPWVHGPVARRKVLVKAPPKWIEKPEQNDQSDQ